LDNNQKYFALMDLYKQLRSDPDKIKESLKVLDAATALRGKGGVDDDVAYGAGIL